MIRLRDVALGYGGRTVLAGVNLTVERGAFMGIVGPNGSGKTTLLRAVLGSLTPLRGSVERPFPPPRIGYVPQRDTLDPLFPLSALDVVVMGCFGRLGPVRRPGRAETAASMEALNHAGIADLARRPYGALSGGQKQRTLIARALAGQPDMLVLDEPTNGMDLEAEAAVMGLLTHLNREHRMTVLMVSHLLNVVVNSADSIAVVSDSGVRAGAVRDVVAKEALDRLYSCGVDVFQVDGRTVVLPARLAGDAP